ncbi:hypothetical protein [Streptosporangium sp. NPDC049046]
MPVIDNPFLDGFSLSTDDKTAHYSRLLRNIRKAIGKASKFAMP